MSGKAARAQPSTAAQPPAFDNCYILYNPNSTDAPHARQRIEALQKLFPPAATTVVQTVPGGPAANRQLLRDIAGTLSGRTLLGIAGGDGTVNLVVDTLLSGSVGMGSARQADILPLWGGNGNDLACTLNGTAGRLPMSKLLQTARRVAIYPLHCEITTGDKTTSHVAICYASFGASAFAAQRLERLRGVRPFFHALGIAKFAHELGMVARAMAQAARITVEDGTESHAIYDRFFINGPRVAKLHVYPLSLTDRRFLYVTVEQKRMSSVAYRIAEVTRRHPERYMVSGDQSVSFTLREATWTQIDGEVMQLAAGTRVHISLSKQPFYALSTLL